MMTTTFNHRPEGLSACVERLVWGRAPSPVQAEQGSAARSPTAPSLFENACSRMPAPMNREFPSTPLVGVGAIIIEGPIADARVLLVKRAHPPLQAQWSIPGGVLEVGELVREAAIREAREETGLIVEPADLLGVYDRVLRNAELRVQYHYVLIDFLCRWVGGVLRAASDAAEVRWFTSEELPALNLAEDTLHVIQKGFAKLGISS